MALAPPDGRTRIIAYVERTLVVSDMSCSDCDDVFVVCQDPDSVLDYRFDFSRWLSTGDELTSATVTTTGGVVITNMSNDTDTVTFHVSGGTVGDEDVVTVHVQTANGLEDDRSMTVVITPM